MITIQKTLTKNAQNLSKKELHNFFTQNKHNLEQIGIEVELAVVNPKTGKSIPYYGLKGIRSLLKLFIAKESKGCTPILEGDILTGYRRDDGVTVTLEHNGAIEYSSAPFPNLSQLIFHTRNDILNLARIAKEFGVVLLATGNTPFDSGEDINWMPKSRTRVMREYLDSFKEDNAEGWRVFGQGLSTQVNFDYADEIDMSQKLTALVPAVPVFNALFANSPIQDGSVNQILSNRSAAWSVFDPTRSGCIIPALKQDISFEEYIDWIVKIPTIFYTKEGIHYPIYDQTFYDLLNDRDSHLGSFNNWLTHFSALFHDIRLKRVIEVRCIDGQSWQNIPSVPTLLTGLIYHEPSLQALKLLFQERTLEEYNLARKEVCYEGLQAGYGEDSIQELALEIIRLAKAGLQARIKAGIEAPKVLDYLKPIESVAIEGITFAERTIHNWETIWNHNPAAMVDFYKI